MQAAGDSGGLSFFQPKQQEEAKNVNLSAENPEDSQRGGAHLFDGPAPLCPYCHQIVATGHAPWCRRPGRKTKEARTDQPLLFDNEPPQRDADVAAVGVAPAKARIIQDIALVVGRNGVAPTVKRGRPKVDADMAERDTRAGLPPSAQAAIADGMNRAEEHADEGWKDEIRDVIIAIAEEKEFFTVDDVLDYVDRHPLANSTHNLSALGPLMTGARRDGLIVNTGRVERSRRAVKHGITHRIWQSKILRRSTA